MDLSIHSTFLPHTDPDASESFYRDVLGFEVRRVVDYGGLKWITVGPPGQPGTSIVLHPPGITPGTSDEERDTVLAMMAKGVYGMLILGTPDLDGTFAQLAQAGVEVVQEPADQPWGIRDCAVRDPAGNLIRIDEVR